MTVNNPLILPPSAVIGPPNVAPPPTDNARSAIESMVNVLANFPVPLTCHAAEGVSVPMPALPFELNSTYELSFMPILNVALFDVLEKST